MMGKWQGLQLWITVRRGQRHPVQPRQGRVACLSQPEPLARWWGQKVHTWHLLFLLGLAGAAVLCEYSYAEHIAVLHWMSGYKSADGVGCCSERDCLPLPIAVLQLTSDQAIVRIGDTVVQLPAKSVHATQDGQTYWCCRTNAHGQCPTEPSRATTRCVFYATGM